MSNPCLLHPARGGLMRFQCAMSSDISISAHCIAYYLLFYCESYAPLFFILSFLSASMTIIIPSNRIVNSYPLPCTITIILSSFRGLVFESTKREIFPLFCGGLFILHFGVVLSDSTFFGLYPYIIIGSKIILWARIYCAPYRTPLVPVR